MYVPYHRYVTMPTVALCTSRDPQNSRNFKISIVRKSKFDAFFREFCQNMLKTAIRHLGACLKFWFSENWVVSRSFWVKIFQAHDGSHRHIHAWSWAPPAGIGQICLPQRSAASRYGRAVALAAACSVCYAMLLLLLRTAHWELLASHAKLKLAKSAMGKTGTNYVIKIQNLEWISLELWNSKVVSTQIRY